MISFLARDITEKIAGLFGMSIESTQMVYCPYWLLVYKNKKVLVDGLSRRIDTEAPREVIGLIR